MTGCAAQDSSATAASKARTRHQGVTRARHAERVLTAPRLAVDRVLAVLVGRDLPPTAASLRVEALVGDQQPDLSQGETDRDAAAR